MGKNKKAIRQSSESNGINRQRKVSGKSNKAGKKMVKCIKYTECDSTVGAREGKSSSEEEKGQRKWKKCRKAGEKLKALRS